MLNRGNFVRPVDTSYTDHIRPLAAGMKKIIQAIQTRKKLMFNKCLNIVLKVVVT